MSIRKLTPKDLKSVCDPSSFPFKTTDDYDFEYEPLHQERGVKGIEFALNVKSEGYNLFVCGPSGTGRNTLVKKLVYEIAPRQRTPDDWVYVYNFVREDEPVAIRLPAGKGKVFKRDIDEMVEDLKIDIPKAFESEDYEKRKHEILKDYKERRDITFQEIEDQAYENGFVLKQTATGIILVPRIEDRAMSTEEFEKIPQEEKEAIEKEKHKLHIKIDQVLNEVRAMEKDAKARIKQLEKEVILYSVRHTIDELRFKFREFEDVIQHLNRLQDDILSNIDLFKAEEDAPQPMPFMPVKSPEQQNVFKKYQVNLLVDHGGSEGAPVIFEPNPTYYNLIGRIEYAANFGAMTTDFTMIAPGAMHKANGGYLILQAMDVMKGFMVWETLKRVIKNHEIKVEDINEQYRVISTTSLKPSPIPSEIKIIMVGPTWLYQVLYHHDDEFKKLFKVKADFDVEMKRDDEKIKKYAAFIKVRCDEEKLRHLDRKAVAQIVEYGARILGKKDKLSARFVNIADILREANYWAGLEGSEYINDIHVRKAIEEKSYRSNLIEDKIGELIEKGILMVDVDGEKVGQINGLAVYDMGDYMFGKPSRITVRTYMGQAGVVDIERQVKMGGNTHSKGVLILNGYIGQKFAQNHPLSLTASICFEQSYDGIDGDSASSTEAYCLLSSLSGVPLKQGIAVTGSMNQHGEVQPIGGVNQKIEGFYHVCKIKGLTGKQGVMIPQTNVEHLMLKDEVIDAVSAGRFHIWAVSSIDEGIEVLTGKKAGTIGNKNTYPKGTINELVQKKLTEYSKKGASGKKNDQRKSAKKKKKKIKPKVGKK
ncbi:MAG: AAA family ATPase [Candidatus Omnitrophica bacterium]|nr:AAA family ATPase [Candidatus Omnitrophota bacterium]